MDALFGCGCVGASCWCAFIDLHCRHRHCVTVIISPFPVFEDGVDADVDLNDDEHDNDGDDPANAHLEARSRLTEGV